MRICLDPGHGRDAKGRWNGARGNGIQEDLWVLQFAKRVGHYLRARGAKTVFTRETNALAPLGERGRIAKRAGCNVFVSIHVNAFGSSSAHGAEALIADGDGNSGYVAGAALKAICSQAHEGRKLRNRGVKRDDQGAHKRLRVLRDTYRGMLSMLIEVGFLTNPEDAAALKDARWVENAACLIAQALTPKD